MGNIRIDKPVSRGRRIVSAENPRASGDKVNNCLKESTDTETNRSKGLFGSCLFDAALQLTDCIVRRFRFDVWHPRQNSGLLGPTSRIGDLLGSLSLAASVPFNGLSGGSTYATLGLSFDNNRTFSGP